MSMLLEGVWGANPPRSAEQSIYTYIAGLRRALEPDRGRRDQSKVLSRVPGGYVLTLEHADVDSVLFAERLDQARQLSGDAAIDVLAKALSLWRGQALSGVPGPFASMERARLEELHLTAIELHADAKLQLNQQDDVIATLQGLTRQHPLRERLRERLMVALHQSGRQAEALEVFEEGRRILAEELGAFPGDGLQRCHALVLGGGARSRKVPALRQLPRDLSGFVGRDVETVRLKSLLAPWDGSPSAPTVAISGPPGVGKSALAIRIAHAVTDRFPDGQLYANLRGATPGVTPVQPLEALGRFLRAMGVPADALPDDLDEAAALWRDRLSGRRVMIVLDDAAGPAQIRALCTAPLGNAVLVTGRESFTALDDCTEVALGTMRHVEAITMLAKLMGPRRAAAEPEQLDQLVKLCDGLPLALRIAGARLMENSDWSVSHLVDLLVDERLRLHVLEAGDLAVRSSFTTSWTSLNDSPQPLNQAAARTLRLLGIPQVPTLTPGIVAALLDTTPTQATTALERLATAHLLDRSSDDHYEIHDLVRLFARELAPEDRRVPLVRALSYYVASARSAAALIDPHRVQAAGRSVEATPYPLTTSDEALDWLVREEANLLGAAHQAMADEDDEIADLGVALGFALMWYQRSAYRVADIIALNERALAVSRRLGDDRMALEAHNHLAGGLYLRGQLSEAIRHHESQLVLARRLGDRFCEQRALGNMAATLVKAERYEEALSGAEAQLLIAREIGVEVGVRYALFMAGLANTRLGRFDQAKSYLEESLAMVRQAGDATQEADVESSLGEVCLAQGDLASGMIHLRAALGLGRSLRLKYVEARCLVRLAKAHRLQGEIEAAVRHIKEAAALTETMQTPFWEKTVQEERAAIEAAG